VIKVGFAVKIVITIRPHKVYDFATTTFIIRRFAARMHLSFGWLILQLKSYFG
jgi:hypothetical protein